MVQHGIFKLVALLSVGLAALIGGSAYTDGTETLGPASIDLAPGSGIAIGGTGLFMANGDGTFSNLDGDISVSVPIGASVAQVLLYWVGESGPSHTDPLGDDSAFINGNPIFGQLIGGATRAYGIGDGTGGIWFATYRADITNLGLVSPGDNTLTISGLDFSYRNTGAGVVVIYDDGTTALIEILDGLDYAYNGNTGDLATVVPQTLVFDPAPVERTAHVPFFVASVGEDRPNVTEITIDGVTTPYFGLFTSANGPEWDSVIVPVTIPAGADSITVEILSADGGGTNFSPASFGWILGGIVIDEPLQQCGDCDGGITQLTIKYTGPPGNPRLMSVVQALDNGDFEIIWYDFSVEGGDEFTVSGINPDGTFGEDIFIFVEDNLHARFRTDCSELIGPGKTSGEFLIIDGESKIGGPLCPYQRQNGEVDFDWLEWWLFWLINAGLTCV